MLSEASVAPAYLARISNNGLLFCSLQHMYILFLTTKSFLHYLKSSMYTHTILISASSPAQRCRRDGKTRQDKLLSCSGYCAHNLTTYKLQATKTVTSTIRIKSLCYSVVVMCFGRMSIVGCDLEATIPKQQTSNQLNLIQPRQKSPPEQPSPHRPHGISRFMAFR